jgi:predicted RNA-binding protein YlqC (UPF0109 family)
MDTPKIEKLAEDLIAMLGGAIATQGRHVEVLKDYSGGTLTEYSIRVHNSDAARLLGKRATTFTAIRNVISLIGAKHGRNINVTMMRESIVGLSSPPAPLKVDPNWPRETVTAVLHRLLTEIFGEVSISLIVNPNRCIFAAKVPAMDRTLVTAVGDNLNRIFSAIGMTVGSHLSVDLTSQ